MKNELALKQRIAELEKLLAQKDEQIAALEERWRLAQQKQFGKSAEGFVGQGELFNEVEEIVEAAEAEQQSISYTRKKPVRKPLPKDLPREQVIHYITDKTCDCCGRELHKMGEDKSESLSLFLLKSK